MNRLNNISFKAKLITLIVVANLILMASGILQIFSFLKSYETSLMNDYSNYAETIGQKISAQFFERYGDIQAFATNESLQSLNGEHIKGYLDTYVKLYIIYDVILFVDKDGNYVASNTVTSGGKEVQLSRLKEKNYADSAWFKAAINNNFTDDAKNAFSGTYVEALTVDPIFEMAFSEKRLSTGFTSAVKNSKGEVIGVLTNRTNTVWFDNELVQTYKTLQQKGKVNIGFTLVDKSGVSLLEYFPKKQQSEYQIQYDLENTILKKNYISEKHPVSEFIGSEVTKSKFATDQATNDEYVFGYHYISNSKWIDALGWSVIVSEPSSEALASAIKAKTGSVITFSIITLFIFIFSTWFSVLYSKKFEDIIKRLIKDTFKVKETAVQMASSATELSESSNQQAAALQETVAAIDEISAMVEKNADSAEKSKSISGSSKEQANYGKTKVSEMLDAISDIDQTNKNISTKITDNINQIKEVTQLIHAINEKTKVINEIVFQTKLLSFNASVEAARAGEAGKGFAVVAEEVGNLAAMSGNAAKEITSMLESSVQKVENMVSRMELDMTEIIKVSNDKVSIGTQRAEECSESLDSILGLVNQVDQLVSEISTASKEQDVGIKEISKAMGQMENATQQNNSVAMTSSQGSESLAKNSEELSLVVDELNTIINGANFKNLESSNESSSDNVIKFSKSKEKEKNKLKYNLKKEKSNFEVSEKIEVAERQTSTSNSSKANLSFKNASGYDAGVPSSEDPGFQ